jgi:hypothetical protein
MAVFWSGEGEVIDRSWACLRSAVLVVKRGGSGGSCHFRSALPGVVRGTCR